MHLTDSTVMVLILNKYERRQLSWLNVAVLKAKVVARAKVARVAASKIQ